LNFTDRIRRKLSELSEILFPEAQRQKKAEAASFFVTPFSPFMISDYYLSEEINELKLQYLNLASVCIGARTVFKPNSVVFVQVDQLEEFEESVLPSLKVPITLITGKLNLPALSDTPAVRRILDSPHIVKWFSQNQVFEHLAIEPFPYGVDFFSAPAVLRESQRAQKASKRTDLLVPFATVHSHLPAQAKEIRTSLQPTMDKSRRNSEYLKSISSSKYVISPPGDRGDTYRHWQCIALGAIPVSQLPRVFGKLFEGYIVLTDDLVGFSSSHTVGLQGMPNSRIAELRYWADRTGSSWKGGSAETSSTGVMRMSQCNHRSRTRFFCRKS